MTFATHDGINFLPSQSFHILVATFSVKARKARNPFKPKMVEYATWHPRSVMVACLTCFYHSPMRIAESVNPIAHSDVRRAWFKATKQTAHGNAPLASESMTDNQQTLIPIFYSKPAIASANPVELQYPEWRPKQLTKDERNEFAIYTQHQAYRQPFIDMLSQFELM